MEDHRHDRRRGANRGDMTRRLFFALLLAFAACASTKSSTGESGAMNAGPELWGFVISVQGHTVRISGGSRDGVREGDLFVVRRIMAGYVGRIRITSVEKDYAAGVFLSRSASACAPPEPGDTATRDDAAAHVYR